MESVKMEIRQSEFKPEVTVWYIEGDLDSNSIETLNVHFSRILEGNRFHAIAEMSKVSNISSAAVGELMGCRQVLSDKGGDLVFAGLSLDCKAKLTHLGANKIFKFHSDLRTAVNAYAWEVQQKPEKVWLSFPPELNFVPPVRQLVSRITRQKGYGQRDSFRIETIVDEVCNNAVEHGAPDNLRDIELFLKIDRKKIEIEVVNLSDPKKINSLKAISKSILGTNEKKLERGRGLSLIKMLSNDLSIDFSGKGTTVHVTKLREE
jgi:anti-sigma regulatory factor (Ser/Thr protein kinase)/anti-anti-sigma regulatory factor